MSEPGVRNKKPLHMLFLSGMSHSRTIPIDYAEGDQVRFDNGRCDSVPPLVCVSDTDHVVCLLLSSLSPLWCAFAQYKTKCDFTKWNQDQWERNKLKQSQKWQQPQCFSLSGSVFKQNLQEPWRERVSQVPRCVCCRYAPLFSLIKWLWTEGLKSVDSLSMCSATMWT